MKTWKRTHRRRWSLRDRLKRTAYWVTLSVESSWSRKTTVERDCGEGNDLLHQVGDRTPSRRVCRTRVRLDNVTIGYLPLYTVTQRAWSDVRGNPSRNQYKNIGVGDPMTENIPSLSRLQMTYFLITVVRSFKDWHGSDFPRSTKRYLFFLLESFTGQLSKV